MSRQRGLPSKILTNHFGIATREKKRVEFPLIRQVDQQAQSGDLFSIGVYLEYMNVPNIEAMKGGQNRIYILAKREG